MAYNIHVDKEVKVYNLKSLRREVNIIPNQHITPHPEGGWQVKAAGASRATVRTDTQAQAYQIGRDIAMNQNSELFLHGKNGQIRDRNSYGNDPFPPRG